MSNGEIPAGWYPDPQGGGGQRWWDGYAWTEHVQAPAPQAPVEPAPVEPVPAPQASSIPAGWYPDPAGSSGQRWWDGGSWTDQLAPASEAELRPEEQTPIGPTEAPAASADVGSTVPSDLGSNPEPAEEPEPVASPEPEPEPEPEPIASPEPEPVVSPEPAIGGAAQAAAEASAASAAVPAGWYPDPAGSASEVWWTGTSWSEHVRGPQNPAGPAGAGQSFTMAGAGYRPPGGPPPEVTDRPSGSGRLIIVIVAVLVLLGAIFAALWFGTDVFNGTASQETVAAEGTDPEPAQVEEEPEPEPEPEPTFSDVRDLDLADLEWLTTCIGTEAAPTARASDPQPVMLSPGVGDQLEHDNPFDPSGLPRYAAITNFVEYGDVTGNGQDDLIVATDCLGLDFFDMGLDVWSLEDGQPVQQTTPPVALPTESVILERFAVSSGTLTVFTAEVQDDGSSIAVVTEYTLGDGSWNVEEIEREAPEAAVSDDLVRGVNFPPLAEGSWLFEPRSTPRDPLIADNVDLPLTLMITSDVAIFGLIGDLSYDEVVEDYLEVFEVLAEEEDVELTDELSTDIQPDGADRGILFIYADPAAQISYYVMLVEVDGLLVEVSLLLGTQQVLEEDPEFLEEAAPLYREFYEAFSFDPAELRAGLES